MCTIFAVEPSASAHAGNISITDATVAGMHVWEQVVLWSVAIPQP